MAIRKYGEENFEVEVVEEVERTLLDSKEKYYIEYYNSLTPNGYNISKGGQLNKKSVDDFSVCPICGKQKGKSAKMCISCWKKHTLKRPDKEILENIDREDLTYSEIGEMFSVSGSSVRKWFKFYGIAKKKKKKKEPDKKQSKRVAKISIDTKEIIAVYDSPKEAANELGIKKSSHICEVCSGKLKSAYGYIWKYIT